PVGQENAAQDDQPREEGPVLEVLRHQVGQAEPALIHPLDLRYEVPFVVDGRPEAKAEDVDDQVEEWDRGERGTNEWAGAGIPQESGGASTKGKAGVRNFAFSDERVGTGRVGRVMCHLPVRSWML